MITDWNLHLNEGIKEPEMVNKQINIKEYTFFIVYWKSNCLFKAKILTLHNNVKTHKEMKVMTIIQILIG